MAETQEPAIDGIIQDLTDDQVVKLRDLWVELGKLTDSETDNDAMKKKRNGMTAEEFRTALWGNVKHEDPDSLLVRYLRWAYWKVDEAVKFAIKSVNWRRKNKIDTEILRRGEAYYADLEQNAEAADEKKFGKQVLDQMRTGKSFLRGVCKEGRPLLFVRPRFHRSRDQSFKALEEYIIYGNETMRMCLRPPHTGVTAVLDMRGFSMGNMDWQILRVGISELAVMYPEGLERLYIVHAPWIVTGIWAVVKGWLDKIILDRVFFVNTIADLEPYIDLTQVPDDTGGNLDWDYKYIEPKGKPGPMKVDDEKKAEILEERKRVLDAFEANTHAMHGKDLAEIKALIPERRKLAVQIRDNYWKLDPYVRGESLMDRVGVIGPDGSYNPWEWKPEEHAEVPGDKTEETKPEETKTEEGKAEEPKTEETKEIAEKVADKPEETKENGTTA